MEELLKTLNTIILKDVIEYCEGLDVEIANTNGTYVHYAAPKEQNPGYGRLVIRAYNEGGHNTTEVDLIELLTQIKKTMPEIWATI